MKPWYQSKTLWTNSLVIAIGIGTLIAMAVDGEGKPLVSASTVAWISLVAVPAGNMILRLITKDGISFGE